MRNVNPRTLLESVMRGEKSATDKTRKVVSTDPACALTYATHVDKFPHPVTREGAFLSGLTAYLYFIMLDNHVIHEELSDSVKRGILGSDEWFIKMVSEARNEEDIIDARKTARQ